MAKVTLAGYQCERCEHKWVPRNESFEPKVCPKCKSPYWDRPRIADQLKQASESLRNKRRKINV